MNDKGSEWRSGLTWRVILAIIYGAIVLMPVNIWGSLMIGTIPPLTWVVVILFYWLSLLYGSPLTKQEILVMFAAASTAIYTSVGLNFSSMFYRIWFSSSPIVKSYGIEKLLPPWYVPSNNLIRNQVIRTFFHPDWLPVITFSLIFWILNTIIGLSLGFFFYELFVETEKLPFPMARVDVEIISQLEERKPEKIRVLVLFGLIGFIYSFIAYCVPLLSQALLGETFIIIPYPWYDMTESFRSILPGAMIGIDTNLLNYMLGIILPYETVLWMFISSFISSVLGNPIVVWYFPKLIPKWVRFPYGMKLSDIMFWSSIYVWYPISIGIAFGVFIEQLIKGKKGFISAIGSLSKISVENRKIGYLSLKSIIIIYLVATITWFLIVSQVMIKGFPIIPLLFLIVIWPFIHGFISIRAYAETGFYLNIPYFNQNIINLTMVSYNIPIYSKLGIWPWFTPLGVNYGSGWTQNFYVSKGVKCTFSSYIKAVIIVATPIAIIFNLLYSEYLWKISPVPSPMFQYAQIFWPINAGQSMLWYTRKVYSFNPLLTLGSFGGLLLLSLIASFIHIPYSSIGVMMGISNPLPTPLALFLGAITVKIIENASKHKIKIREYAYMMIGGYAIGSSIAITLAVSAVIFSKSVWPLPF